VQYRAGDIPIAAKGDGFGQDLIVDRSPRDIVGRLVAQLNVRRASSHRQQNTKKPINNFVENI